MNKGELAMETVENSTIDKEQVLKHIEEDIAKYSDLVIDNLHMMHCALTENDNVSKARSYGDLATRQKAAIEVLKDLAEHLKSLPKEQEA